MQRDRTLELVRKRNEPWDIVVIGGGATGVGCALDAASRGLEVLLIEQHDLGKGTSSRSTKLLHGGVRYLAQGNITLVREALFERGVVFANAPGSVAIQPFIVPCYSVWQTIKYTAGLKLYDLLAGRRSLGRSRILKRNETIERLPNVNQKHLRAGVLYFDGIFDDSRLLIELAQTAAASGASILTYAKLVRIEKRLTSPESLIEFVDLESEDHIEVMARAVINATGAFSDQVRQLSDQDAGPLLKFSQGIHLVLDRRFLPTDDAMMIPVTPDGRVLFCIPWHERLLVGTTETPIDRPVAEPVAQDAEIGFVLEAAGAYLSERPTRDDILSVFAGIRPLIGSSQKTATSRLSREHRIEVDRSGMVTIAGGKWTTYRKMAADAVDRAIEAAGLRSVPSRTIDLPIVHRSSETTDGERLCADLPYTTGDVRNAVVNEFARSIEDVLARRTRILFIDARAALEIAPDVGAIVGELLGWTEEKKAKEVEEFTAVAAGYLPRHA